MLTVIFYRKSSQPFIDRYKSLFQPYIDKGQIEFCFWDENGREPKDAFKQLSSIVHGIREWRALVALPPDEDPRGAKDEYLRTRDDNPFDYLCNSNPEPLFKESDVPLIRLAQMLGGVPLVSHHFQTADLSVIGTEESEETLRERQDIWNDLNDRYSLSYDMPERLFLFTARYPKRIMIPTMTDVELANRHEINSSMFWYRNRYPAKARFMIQDCARPGHAHHDEDLFRFWMTVLTLALNPIPSGMLEAYKLYNVQAVVSRDEVHQLFSDYYHRLSGIRFAAEKQVIELRKQMQMKRERDNLPEYHHEIPVWFDNIREDNMFISSRDIGLAGDCPIQEEPWWYRQVAESMKAVSKVFRKLQIELDRASLLTRLSSKVNDTEIAELDEYQYNEMAEQLAELEKEILMFNTNAVLPRAKYNKDLNEAKKAAATSMRKRMTRKMTVTAGLVGILVFIVSFLPDVFYQYLDGASFLMMFGVILIGGLLMALTIGGALWDFRAVIQMKISDYNAILTVILNDIRKSANIFSDYLSKCCSYMRGMDMLQALKRRTMISAEGIITMTRHINQLTARINLIEDWMTDFELTPLPDDGTFSRIVFDYEIDPQRNNGYLIDIDMFDPDIPGPGGMIFRAPYPFVDELCADRVAVFEDLQYTDETDDFEEENE